jgi:hypothetical protein
LRSSEAKLMRLCLKNKLKKITQVVECLLSKHEAMSSLPSTRKKKKRKGEKKGNYHIYLKDSDIFGKTLIK